MPEHNPNPPQRTPGPMISLWLVLIILALLLSGVALYFALHHMPGGHHDGGCCCCGGGGGGTNSASGNPLSLGGSRSGNLNTVISSMPGIVDIDSVVDIDINGTINQMATIGIYLSTTTGNFTLTLVRPNMPNYTISPGVPYQFPFNGTTEVHWVLVPNSPYNNIMTNLSPVMGEGTSGYNGSFSFLKSDRTAGSASVFVNSN